MTSEPIICYFCGRQSFWKGYMACMSCYRELLQELHQIHTEAVAQEGEYYRFDFSKDYPKLHLPEEIANNGT